MNIQSCSSTATSTKDCDVAMNSQRVGGYPE